jgi:glycine/D-amino acid oxidase-like deaminating enzyme
MVDLDRALRDARPLSHWLDAASPEPRAPLTGSTAADLVVVGGGYAGLWTALLAKERDPGRDVIVLEADRVGHAASGRNGGFCAASLTHGAENGRERWPREYDTLERLGHENLDELEATLDRYGIDAGFERTGELTVATEPYQVDHLREHAAREPGIDFLDGQQVRSEVASPTYLAASFDPSTALVDPARLAWGLAGACDRLGVRIVEHTPALALTRAGTAMAVSTARGSVRAAKVALATNAFPTLIRRMRFHTVPVYDYVLMSEPLNASQLADVGWSNRQGIGDSANQFHYYRRSADDRILWGGYDAVYFFGGKVDARYDTREATHRRLAEHFYATFPQLEDVRFTHAWGGAIDTCTRFCAFYGTAHRGDVAYALGFTGLGVGATRFAANVVLDLLDGKPTERTELEMVRTKPLPFPPEPLAWLGITATRWSLDHADRNGGRRNLWLRTLDRLGLGFDS